MPTVLSPRSGLRSARSILWLLGFAPLALSGCLVDELENVKDPVDADGDGFTEDVDCDDRHPAIHPDAQEICDGDPLDGVGEVDNNCNGLAGDEDPTLNRSGLAGTWYRDADGDGYGDGTGQLGSRISGCVQPDGYVVGGGDCDDTNSSVQPESREICGDSIDNDCDGETDVVPSEVEDPTVPTWARDEDGDGYGDRTILLRACEQPAPERDPALSAAAGREVLRAYWVPPRLGTADDELSVDDWSSGEIDLEELPSTAFDCPGADNDVLSNPGAPEDCTEIDRNCDGSARDGALGATEFWLDGDGDGFGDPTQAIFACSDPAPTGYKGADSAPDCDDENIFVKPGALDPGGERCDGLDNDCDGDIDNDNGPDLGRVYTWCKDNDQDGFPNSAQCVEAYCQPDRELSPASLRRYVGIATRFGDSALVEEWADCDDTDDYVSPGADELCDAIDNDCDGETDESPATDAPDRFLDADGDGYGDRSAGTVAECMVPVGYAAADGDCDDAASGVNPGATDVCNNGASEDCADDTDCLMAGGYVASVADVARADGLVGYPWALLRGSDAGGLAGTQLIGGGDVDGAGLSELFVYAPLSGNGKLFIVDGVERASGTAVLSVAATGKTITGTGTDALGFAAAGHGNLAGGAAPDLLLGAPGAGGVGAVAVYAWPLSTGATNLGLADAAVRLTGPLGGVNFGAQVGAFNVDGDLDGSSRPVLDVIVGTARRSETAVTGGAGGAWVIYGPFGPGELAVADASATHFGGTITAVNGVGDVNNDGTDELVFADAAGLGLTYGDFAGLPDCSAPVDCADRRLSIGSSFTEYSSRPVYIEALGDINGDGYADVGVGLPYADTLAGGDEGEVAVWLGGPGAGTIALAADFSILGADAGGRAGSSLVGGVDLDLDGLDDFAVGSPGDGAPLGGVYVFYGSDVARGATYSVYAARTFILGSAANPGLGHSVALLEDGLGDGTPDIAVGLPSLSVGGGAGVGGAFLFGQAD